MRVWLQRLRVALWGLGMWPVCGKPATGIACRCTMPRGHVGDHGQLGRDRAGFPRVIARWS